MSILHNSFCYLRIHSTKLILANLIKMSSQGNTSVVLTPRGQNTRRVNVLLRNSRSTSLVVENVDNSVRRSLFSPIESSGYSTPRGQKTRPVNSQPERMGPVSLFGAENRDDANLSHILSLSAPKA